MIVLSPIKRRLLYVSIFELLGILFSTLLLMAINQGDMQESLPVAVIISTAAVVWNFIYNTGFEAWEQRRQVLVRTFKIRTLHAIGFEGGLLLICLPLYMLWYGVGVWTAISMEIALLAFFLVYTFVFTLLFDQVFARHNLQS
ncbi:MAG: PACE efflux transporter [Pseudomonadaceae bacterium]|nr:PACE efflux transporter [Pseudomonadaceae bacterium]